MNKKNKEETTADGVIKTREINDFFKKKDDLFMKECRRLIAKKLGNLKMEELNSFVKGVNFGMELAKIISVSIIRDDTNTRMVDELKKHIKGEA